MAAHKERDRLALAATSLTQRQMAAVAGVSPRTIGRWLREGRPDGVRAIPLHARASISVIYDLHKSIAARAARDLHVPYLSATPVLAVRKQMQRHVHIDGIPQYHADGSPVTRPRVDPKTGAPIYGDRAFVEHAQFLSRAQRDDIIAGFAVSGIAVFANVSSTIDLARYYQETLAIRLEENKTADRPMRKADLVKSINKSFEDTFKVDPKTLVIASEIKRINTARIHIGEEFHKGYRDSIDGELRKMNDTLYNKHAPATGEPGTLLAHTIIIQLTRESTDELNQSISKGYSAQTKRGRH